MDRQQFQSHLKQLGQFKRRLDHTSTYYDHFESKLKPICPNCADGVLVSIQLRDINKNTEIRRGKCYYCRFTWQI